MKTVKQVCLLITLEAVFFMNAASQGAISIDSSGIKALQLNEIVVCDQTPTNDPSATAVFYKSNRLATTEDILARTTGVSLIRRGAYGMDPVLRVYSAGQINLTVNGMRIYGACTDRMDPATIYIEPGNLHHIQANMGAAGNETGSTIGGGLNMQTKQAEFSHCTKTYVTASLSYASVNRAVNVGAAANMSLKKIAFRINTTYRKASDYRTAGKKIIANSAYEKFNTGSSVSFLLNTAHKLYFDYIGDWGWNIGYPALTMDAGKATAHIASATHLYTPASGLIKQIESKVYFNHISHSMDDTHRQDTLMHMDMPGLSYTAGTYTDAILGIGESHEIKIRFDYAANYSKASMTMYPENAKPMYMLTLPDNCRHFSGLFVSERFRLNNKHSLQLRARLEYMLATITSAFGRKQASIFSSETGKSIGRIIPSINLSYQTNFRNRYSSLLILSYGERAANNNELFGFYLYNRFDGYDYIGNLGLNNERTLQAEWNGVYSGKYVQLSCAAYYNYIFNYILGIRRTDFSSMTAGARGVKQYANAGSAHIAGAEIKIGSGNIKGFQTLHTLKYSYGRFAHGEPLPLVPPLKCYHVVRYGIKGWYIQAEVEWAAAQNRVNAASGEQNTPAYALLHLRTGYKLNLRNHLISLNLAAENILDKNYREHLDWGNISRPGRNFVITLSYTFSQ